MNFEKQKKLFRVSKFVFAALCALFIIGLFLQMVCMLWICLLPDKLAGFFESFCIWRPFVSDMYRFNQATAELCSSMLTYAFAVFITKNAWDIFSSLEKGEAFPILKLRYLALSVLLSALIVPFVESTAFKVFVGTANVKATFDVGMLALGLLLAVLSFGITNKNEE